MSNNNNDRDYDYKKVVPPRLHRFYEIVGKQKYEEVLDEYGGNSLYFSCKESYDKAVRNRDIYDDYLKNVDYLELTSKYKLSVTTVRNIISQCQEEDRAGKKNINNE